jgi:uncharacterized DUF497 family protein
MQHPSQAVAFEWDVHNETELAGHEVLPYEVEQVFWNGPRFSRNKNRAAARWRMLGRTDGGRTLQVFVVWADQRGGILRAVTGWEIR